MRQKQPASCIDKAAGWSGDRVLADLLNRGSNYGSLSGFWTTNRTELVRHIRHWAFVAIKARCKKIASQVPNVSYRTRVPVGKKGFLTKSMRHKTLVRLAHDEDLVPAPPDHPLVHLLRHPNSMDTMWDLWYEQELFGCSTGNVYFWTPKSIGFNKPAEMWVMPSHWVWPVIGRERLIEGYEIRPVDGAYKRLFFPADEVIHIKYKSPISKIDGQSPLDAVSRWVDSSESVDQSRWHTFKQGTFGSVAIKLGPEFFDPLDSDIARVEQKWLQRYQGERHAGKPIILPPGLDIVPLMMSAREMDYCASAEQLRDAILSAFDVTKMIVGITEGVQRNTAETALAQFSQMAINPTLEMIGQALTKRLAAQFDEDLVIWWDDTSPADRAQTNEDIKVDAACHSRSLNEIREERGLEAWDDGDDPPAVYMMKKQQEFQPQLDLGMLEAGDDYSAQIGTQDAEKESKPGRIKRLLFRPVDIPLAAMGKSFVIPNGTVVKDEDA
jgi:HK97 family phage portal protein